MCNSVVVLLSSYNGEAYIYEQLDSLLRQRDVSLRILIRDDGSSDKTVDIIRSYNSDRIELLAGENLGFAQSFWTLLRAAPKADYYAFCDQDDIWFDDKIISAINLIKDIDRPALYINDVVIIDKNKKINNDECFGVKRKLSYPESLIRNEFPGCTYVFNNLLRDNLIVYDGFMISHDWTTYIIASALGRVIFDPVPHMYYRIHGNNAIGFSSIKETFTSRVLRYINPKQVRTRSRVAGLVYRYFSHIMDRKTERLTYNFANCSNSIKSAVCLLRYRNYWNLSFIIMLISRRV